MEHFNYLIIGGGMTADSAVKGIREIDLSGRIGIMSQEEFAPYDRPPLTKGLWFGKSVDTIWRKTEKERVSLLLKKSVVSIDPQSKVVKESSGESYSYDKLLLATGGTPKKLPCPDTGVIYFRTLSDYYKLRDLYNAGEDFIIIGGGYIGTELAAALAMNGKNVTLIVRDRFIGLKKHPKKMAAFLTSMYTEKGVKIVPEASVVSVKAQDGRSWVETDKGEKWNADVVLAGIGIHPEVELAQAIGANVENGIVVDHQLKTTLPDIWAAGDCANFYCAPLDKRMRIEHEDTANSQGRCVGRNMAGAGETYSHLPFFYSDLFEISYEAIGEISSQLEMVEEWIEPYRHGAVYYLKEGTLRGAIFWNVWNKIDQAREIISSRRPFTKEMFQLEETQTPAK